MWCSRRQESVFKREWKNEIVTGEKRGVKIGEIIVCLHVNHIIQRKGE